MRSFDQNGEVNIKKEIKQKKEMSEEEIEYGWKEFEKKDKYEHNSQEDVRMGMIEERNATFSDRIVLNGLFLGLEGKKGEKIYFEKNEFYSQLIPDDIVKYYLRNEKIVIYAIMERRVTFTPGVVSHIENEIYYFQTPLLPSSFQAALGGSILTYPKLKKGSRVILRIGLYPQIHLIREYGNISDRSRDDEVILDLYTENFHFPLSTWDGFEYQIFKHKPLYHKPFTNLKHLNTFNIDPKYSKDFDDAISIDRAKNRLYVHIVDICQMESLGDEDRRAMFLGYTIYLPNQNVPMLPRHLSDHTYSLIKNEERQVITIEMEVNFEEKDEKSMGPKVLNTWIYPSVIKVKERYDYENCFMKNDPDLLFLKELTERYYRRYIQIKHPQFVIDPDSGKTLSIQFEDHSSISHLMVEMLMIMSNRLVTEHINASYQKEGREMQCPERFHQKCYVEEVEEITEDENVNQICMIQKYRMAKYDETETGHFGLKLDHYTHFTSPIRRYFDQIIHRMLGGWRYSKMSLKRGLEYLNRREVWNETLIRLYQDWKRVDYLLQKGSFYKYKSYVINVSKNGIKIYISELGYDTFIPLPMILQNVFWNYEMETKSLKGNDGQTLQTGHSVFVQTDKINFLSRDIVKWKIVSLST